MKITINQELAVSLDVQQIERAGALLGQLRNTHGTNILDGLFILLMFRELEKTKPGTIARLERAAKDATKKKKGASVQKRTITAVHAKPPRLTA